MEDKKPQIGEYIRTKDGDIFKLAKYYNLGRFEQIQDNMGTLYGRYDKVIKIHSFNLIDLVETGDFVNKNCVQEINRDNNGDKRLICGPIKGVGIYYWQGDIKSFITKEQFKDQEKWNKILLK